MNKLIIYPDGRVTDETGTDVFKSSISQQDARDIVHDTIKENGCSIEEEWEMDDDSIEVTINRS